MSEPNSDETVATPGAGTVQGGDTRPASSARQPLDPVPGAIGRYAVKGEMGRGGMGVVYCAHDPVLDRPVALKVLSKVLSSDQEFRERFLREARAIARIEHPNVVKIHDAGEEDGQPFFAMEYCDGESVDRLLARAGSVPVDEALGIVQQAALGLQAAHQARIIHRDIKPSNLIREVTGRVKVVDFGLAKESAQKGLTATGFVMGTPEYMSPEQARGQTPDHRSDIYSLGATLYQLLVGRAPFTGSNPLAILQEQINTAPTPVVQLRPDTPLTVQRLLDRMMAKDPAARPQDYGTLLAELGNARDPIAPEAGLRRYCWRSLVHPGDVLSCAALLDRSVGECYRFLFRLVGLVALLGMVCPPHDARAVLAGVVILLALPPALALGDWVLALLFGSRTDFRRFVVAEGYVSAYWLLIPFSSMPGFGPVAGLVLAVAGFRARWAAAGLAARAGRFKAFMMTLLTTLAVAPLVSIMIALSPIIGLVLFFRGRQAPRP
ncbi:MAG: serine/threonine protein kinase [Candidatus Riflebacteria bacterium]|nr:serine/threonine protein kinase [Candidatus Riflebacteria bacterium]